MQIENLYEVTHTELQNTLKRCKLTLDARATLAKIARIISRAGGEISEQDLASTTLGDFAVLCAQNDLWIEVKEAPIVTLGKN